MTGLLLRQHHQSISQPIAAIALVMATNAALIALVTAPESEKKTITLEAKPPAIVPFHMEAVYDKYFQRTKIITGSIRYSFVPSLIDAGLSQAHIKSLLSLIEKDFDIIQSVSNGAQFAIKLKTDRYNEKYISSFYYFDSNNEYFIKDNGKESSDNISQQDIYPQPYFIMPVDESYRVSSGFNMRRKHPVTRMITPHLGTDYAVPIGTPIHSIADGVVIKSRYNRFAGDYINVQHLNGMVSRYLHLSLRFVDVGDRVEQGEVIAHSGNSGRTTGPHLHLELIDNGRATDYERFMQTHPQPPINHKAEREAKLERQELTAAIKMESEPR
ncbi:M23 family metallopeptidase [Vibrio sagamiensis]|uniref:Peptidase M23 n=1 Tax=Vibrio sagamiensis NBRC 104589 TaxID=1219064 RepID=A0A511QEP1_9VIBR|nr:peptidoglycan DD-metalloendopeptidase family protein [Vibrio sagamiensis]GEM75768.1 peptidase M23 [Vibrio sagamiensis NBRC 104589]